MEAGGRKRALTEDAAMDTPASVTGKRDWAPLGVAEGMDGHLEIRGGDAARRLFTWPLLREKK